MKTFTFLTLCLTSSPVFALELDETPTLTDLAFLTGSWEQDKGDQVVEVQWSPVNGDSMVGTWRAVEDKK